MCVYLKIEVVPSLLAFNNNYSYKLVNYNPVFHAGVNGVSSLESLRTVLDKSREEVKSVALVNYKV